jgi:hypothetical protein
VSGLVQLEMPCGHSCVQVYMGTNLNGAGMYTSLVSMHVLLVNACSSVMLPTKCLVQVKHDIGYK